MITESFSKKIVRIAITFAGIAALTANTRAEDIQLVVVDAFGIPLPGCTVTRFQDSSLVVGGAVDLTSKFRALMGTAVPPGTYSVSLQCDGTVLREVLTVHKGDLILLVVQSARLLRADHIRPELRIEFVPPPRTGEIWWIHLVGVYNREGYTKLLSWQNPEARFVDPEPGSYVVILQSTSGDSCSHRIDFLEFTRLWKVDPVTCNLSVDRFAHVIDDTRLRKSKTDPWYEEMRQYVGRFEDALRDTVKR